MIQVIINLLFAELLQNISYCGLMLYIAKPSLRDCFTKRSIFFLLLLSVLFIPLQLFNDSTMLISYIIIFMLYTYMIRQNSTHSWTESYMIALISFLIGSFLQIVPMGILAAFQIPLGDVNDISHLSLPIKFVYVGQFLLTILFCKCFAIRKWCLHLLNHSRILSILSVSLLLLISVMTKPLSFDLNMLISTTTTILICIIFAIIFVYEEIQIQRKRQAFRDYSTYMPILDDMITLLRQRQHLYSNQLLSLSQLLEQESDYDTLCQTIQQIIQWSPTEKSSYAFLQLSNRLLAGLLYTKFQAATKLGITLEIRINRYEYTSNCTELEIVDLTGILLDNAIEASQTGDTIYITIGADPDDTVTDSDHTEVSPGAAFHIQIENPAPILTTGQIQQMFAKNYTTKKNGNGIGLYIVQKMVQKHKGAVYVYNTTPHKDTSKQYLCIEVTI